MNIEKFKAFYIGLSWINSLDKDAFDNSDSFYKALLEKTSNVIPIHVWEEFFTERTYFRHFLEITYEQNLFLFGDWSKLYEKDNCNPIINFLEKILEKGFPENINDYIDGKLTLQDFLT